ncbi:ABC transporter ATP-binding protein [Salicibibacter cibi]|uniref:ABC transporter ATP-binding protein n=1 Tax=Salicibibacter cibi TaxID=2743001 RepID=A0A7T6ZD29_9BACI|nr:ABC transporter ATP-binding protein [Salicibibacter cibi]QQK80801.1 ABC transporter ATP-binding protein [Salicibibacter cibi]
MTTKGHSQKEAHVIEVHQLKMRYGPKDVLKDVNFSIKRGEVLALLGPNGAGKTSTIEILEGFRIPSGGDVQVLGVTPKEGDESWRAQLGIVMQSWRDHPKWRVLELLEHLGRYYEPYASETRMRPMDAADLIVKVGLQEQVNQKVSSLSGGQRRRLDVAIGLIGNPEILFLDEPTTGFDPQARRDFHEVIRRLSEIEDTTILLTTHDLHEAEKLSDRILILADGRIVANGSAEQLAEKVAGTSEVRWVVNNERFQQEVIDAPRFVQELFVKHGDTVTDLEVRKASLEDSYIKMVQHIKTTDRLENTLANFEEGTE